MLSETIKDATFNETIQHVLDFFQQKQLTVKIESVTESEIHSWGCVIKLYYKNMLVDSSNGKGTSRSAALASGLGELFERFSNHSLLFKNTIFYKQWQMNNYSKYSYYLHPQEKELNYEQLFTPPIIADYYASMFPDYEQRLQFISFILEKRYLGVPYQSFLSKEIYYINPILLRLSAGTNGMCAGNSFYEAFNQGCSELLERHCIAQLLNQQKTLQLYELELSSITSPTLLNYISLLQSDNLIHIYDLSYNFHMPVVLVILINKITKKITINAGAFPIFEIACERCFTEIYQNRNSLNLSTQIQTPFYNYTENEVALNWLNSVQNGSIFPEHLILNAQKVLEINSIYLTEFNTNQQVYKYYQDLFQQLHYDCYYLITQQTQTLCAIQIYSPNLTDLTGYKALFTSLTKQERKICLDFFLTKQQLLVKLMHGQKLSLLELAQLFPLNIPRKNWSYLYSLENGVNQLLPFTADPYGFFVNEGCMQLLTIPLHKLSLNQINQLFFNSEFYSTVLDWYLNIVYASEPQWLSIYPIETQLDDYNELSLLNHLINYITANNLNIYNDYIKESL